MFQTQTVSDSLHNIVAQVDALAAKEAPTLRDCWQGLDLAQQYADILGEMAEDLPPYDERVTIKIEGQGVRFENIEKFLDFVIIGVMKHGN